MTISKKWHSEKETLYFCSLNAVVAQLVEH